MEKQKNTEELVSLRGKCHALWMALIIGGIVLCFVGIGVWSWKGIQYQKGESAVQTKTTEEPITQQLEKSRTKMEVAEAAPGHWVTGCGCGCDGCTYRWFMHDDIQYKLPWHPGKCKAQACRCPCEHRNDD